VGRLRAVHALIGPSSVKKNKEGNFRNHEIVDAAELSSLISRTF
jgi:hypothetical protein